MTCDESLFWEGSISFAHCGQDIVFGDRSLCPYTYVMCPCTHVFLYWCVPDRKTGMSPYLCDVFLYPCVPIPMCPWQKDRCIPIPTCPQQKNRCILIPTCSHTNVSLTERLMCPPPPTYVSLYQSVPDRNTDVSLCLCVLVLMWPCTCVSPYLGVPVPVCPHTDVSLYLCVPVRMCPCTCVSLYLCVPIPICPLFTVRVRDRLVQGLIVTGMHRYGDL